MEMEKYVANGVEGSESEFDWRYNLASHDQYFHQDDEMKERV